MKNTHDEENWLTGQKIGQDLAKNDDAVHPTTHGSLDALRKRIRKDTAQYFGRTNVPHYVIRLSRGGKRTVFILTSNLDQSAKTARDIKAHLALHGWDKTVATYCAPVETKSSGLTIGRFLELAKIHSHVDPITFSSYASKFRQVAAGVMKIDYEGNERFSGTIKPSKWRLAVNNIPLDSITPTAVLRWRSQYLGQKSKAQGGPTKAQHTANTIISNARSLFSDAAIKNLLNSEPTLKMPGVLPFKGVGLLPERDADYFYISEVDAKNLIREAFVELTGEVLVSLPYLPTITAVSVKVTPPQTVTLRAVPASLVRALADGLLPGIVLLTPEDSIARTLSLVAVGATGKSTTRVTVAVIGPL